MSEHMAQELTVMRCSCASENQMRNFRGIFDRIVLSQKAAEASTTDDDLLVSGKVLPYALDVIYYLLECVRLGQRALTMSSVIE